MRGLLVPTLVIIAVLLLGLGFLLVHPWPEGARILANLLQPNVQAAPVNEAAPAQPLEDKGRIRGKGRSNPGLTEPVEVNAPETKNISAPLPAEKKYPFPVAEQTVPGTPEATVLASFGSPEVNVTGADSGQLHKRYVYADHTTGRVTYIAMVNAVVTNAYTVIP